MEELIELVPVKTPYTMGKMKETDFFYRLPAKAHERWQVVFSEKSEGYRIGLYLPEFTKPEEIQQLEKHNYQEVFLLISGKMGLVIRDEHNNPQTEQIVTLEPGRPVVVAGYHNGFSSDNALCYVFEADNIETEFGPRF